jgi:hypothetical protein
LKNTKLILRFVAIAAVTFTLGSTSIFGQTETAETPKATADTKQESKADEPKPLPIWVADDNLKFSASGTWKSVKPKSNMLEVELKIPRVGDDDRDGRLTIMGAGGSIEANIVRWEGQFIQPDGSPTSEKSKSTEKEVAGQKVNMVDISGTFMDGAPFSGQKIERESYRMLAAIVQTEKHGNYFVKFYGPKATVDANAKHFKAMIQSLKVTE